MGMGPAVLPGPLASQGTVGHIAAAAPEDVLTGKAGEERRGMFG